MSLRLSGALLHISSLPSRHGIGDLGPEAYAFARLLASHGQSVWQFLPLNPTSTGIGNSPYSSPSAFAGNILFISPELLLEEGFVSQGDIALARQAAGTYETENHARVDYPAVECQRRALLDAAYDACASRLGMDASFTTFVDQNRFWLEDYARFVTLKEAHGGAAWPAWPHPLSRRDPAALAAWDAQAAEPLRRVCFFQYLFFRQWARLRAFCTEIGVRLVGDVPIYVTHDSSDVWANRSFFLLDEAGAPTVVAGVPPDYFSPTGQRWGNPLYDWAALKREEFSWWVSRIRHNLALCDMVRLDHFRGFAGYWEIPAAEPTAVNGRWVDAPGQALFATLTRRLTTLPLIAEDLGVITPDVRELQRKLDLPGMAVLQFGFGGDLRDNPHTPFNHRHNQVVYTGTHDNPPTRAWFCEGASWDEKQTLSRYAGHEVSEGNAARTLTRLALASTASLTVVPVQDILDLGPEGRMNTPSTTEHNWGWRLSPNQLCPASLGWFAEQANLFDRRGR